MHLGFFNSVFPIFFLIPQIYFGEAIVFRFTNAVCESYNKTLFVIHLCRIRAISRHKTTFNLNSTMLHPIYQERIQIQTFKRTTSLSYAPWLYNIKVDGCKFISRPYNPFFILIFNLFKDFTNFLNMRCPLSGPAIIDGFYLRPELLKLPLPTGDYLISIAWHCNTKLSAYTNLSFQFVEDFNAFEIEKSLSHG